MSSTNNITKDTAVQHLLSGLTTEQVAAACGVSPAYISQLRKEPEIEAQLLAAGAALTLEDKAFDSRLETAESLALSRIEKSLGFANMGQALQAFKVLNSARKRKDAAGAGTGATHVSVSVNLTLPTQAAARYITNARNEIVEVEGKTMISASVKSIDELLAKRPEAVASVAKRLEKTANLLDNIRPAPRVPARLPAGLTLSADLL